MTSLLQLTPEMFPATGVIHSVNAKTYLAGFELLRVSDFTCRAVNTIGEYAQCGQNFTIPFPAHQIVTGSIGRAYVNGAEFRLAMGVAGIPLGTYIDNATGISEIMEATKAGGFEAEGRNTYPLKTEIRAIIGADGIAPASDPLNSLGQLATERYQRILVVKGAIIDSIGITFNRNSLVTSGPIDFEAEFAYWLIKDIA